MRKTPVMAAAAVLAVVGIAGGAFAQTTPEVVVTTQKAVEKDVGRTSSGVPIREISLTYIVSAAGLDPTSHSGALELEKRVNDAALDACKELGSRYPNSTPSDAQCARDAANKAMAQVRKLEGVGKK